MARDGRKVAAYHHWQASETGSSTLRVAARIPLEVVRCVQFGDGMVYQYRVPARGHMGALTVTATITIAVQFSPLGDWSYSHSDGPGSNVAGRNGMLLGRLPYRGSRIFRSFLALGAAYAAMFAGGDILYLDSMGVRIRGPA